MILVRELPNGMKAVYEQMPGFRSVSFGVWIRAGSMLETEENNGLSHFMEHMSFKGTPTRSARQIAEEMDVLGGQMNAATGKMTTSYYAKVIDEDLSASMDLMADMIMNAAMTPEDVEKERGVILEEISMVEDSPEDIVYDVLAEALYGGQALGRTILGPAESIAAYPREELVRFRRAYYSPANAVLSGAGGLEPEAFFREAEKVFGSWTGGERCDYPSECLKMDPAGKSRDKETEQTHLCVGFEGLPMGSDRRYAWSVMNSILGGSVSSRLFQRIREDMGLAYSVYSGLSSYPCCGDFSIYAAAGAKNIPRVTEEIDHVLSQLRREGFTDQEFRFAKAQIKSSFILGLESSYSRMSANGTKMALLETVTEPEELIRLIDAVTPAAVSEAFECLASSPRTWALVGDRAGELLGILPRH